MFLPTEGLALHLTLSSGAGQLWAIEQQLCKSQKTKQNKTKQKKLNNIATCIKIFWKAAVKSGILGHDNSSRSRWNPGGIDYGYLTLMNEFQAASVNDKCKTHTVQARQNFVLRLSWRLFPDVIDNMTNTEVWMTDAPTVISVLCLQQFLAQGHTAVSTSI